MSGNDIKNWDILWDKNYYKTASIKNSMRDTYVVGIMHAYKEDLLQAKKDYEDNIEKSRNLTSEQKKRLKHLYNVAADSIKDYCQECLRIDGRLVE